VTDEHAARLEDLQEVLGEGPGFAASREDRLVAVTVDGSGDDRWPHFAEAAHELLGGTDTVSAEVHVALDGGRTISGTVAGVRADALLTTTFSRIAPKHRLAAWVRLLALSAARPATPFRAVTIGRAPRGPGVTVATIAAVGADAARGGLAALLELYDRAMREPLALACETSAAYARAARAGDDAFETGRRAWESDYNWDKEDVEPEHELVFGGVRRFAELIDPEPVEASAFARDAIALWGPLLEVEEVTER
jgi:exodeoxyribonuclease V gamma subunit